MTTNSALETSVREFLRPVDYERPYLSVVIPVFNEAERIRGALEHIARYLAQCCLSSEILVVDGGSTDGSVEAAKAAAVNEVLIVVLRLAKTSVKGHAVQQGILRARGEVILVCDADLSTTIDELSLLLCRMREGFDLVVASRALPDSRITFSRPHHRVYLGRLFNSLIRWLLVEDIADTQCGFTLITRKVAQAIFPGQRIMRRAFGVELHFLAQRFGFTVAEVPVRWYHVGPVHFRPLQNEVRVVIDLLRIRWHWWTGGYEREGCVSPLGSGSPAAKLYRPTISIYTRTGLY